MTRDERLEFCVKCKKRKFNVKDGLICSLTNSLADFELECESFDEDEIQSQKIQQKETMTGNVEKGKTKTIVISTLYLAFSIILIALSYMGSKGQLSDARIISELIKVTVIGTLLYFINAGINWIRLIFVFYMMFNILMLILAIIGNFFNIPLMLTMLFLLAVFVYMAYFFLSDKDFLKYFNSKRAKDKAVE